MGQAWSRTIQWGGPDRAGGAMSRANGKRWPRRHAWVDVLSQDHHAVGMNGDDGGRPDAKSASTGP